MASLHPSSLKKKKRIKNAERSFQSRKFTESLSNHVTIPAKEEIKKVFQLPGYREFYSISLCHYTSMSFTVVHDNGMPSGKSSNLAVV